MPQTFATVIEENAHKEAHPVELESCPKCSHPMTSRATEASCHSCGHRQPVIQVESRKQRIAKVAYLLPFIRKVN